MKTPSLGSKITLSGFKNPRIESREWTTRSASIVGNEMQLTLVAFDSQSRANFEAAASILRKMLEHPQKENRTRQVVKHPKITVKTLDDPMNWKIACKMAVDVAVNDWQDSRPRKTGKKLMEFVSRELNTERVYRRSGHAIALAKIYGATRQGMEITR